MKTNRLIPFLIIYFVFSLAACQEKSFKQIDIELNSKKAKAPIDIQELKKKTKKVLVNKQGFLESEFRYGIILIYIPSGKFTMGTTRGEKKELPELPDGSQANFADVNYFKKFGEKGRNSDRSIDDGYAQTSPVDAFPKGQSPYGVFDMAGNTIDWLYDWYDPEYYSKSPAIDPNGPARKLKRKKRSIQGGWASNLQRCIRGGAWTDASGELSLAEGGHSIRSDMRERTDQFSSDDHLGFRVAVSYY